jgi:acetyl esterase/lipase
MFIKRSCTYRVVAGCQIEVDVYRLPDHVIRPAILWLHGGALIFGDRETLSPDQLERYVRAGYTVIAADYRLAPEVKLEAIIEDLEVAYEWVRVQGPDLFRIDPERIAVIGHSAGGYLALMTGFCVNPHPKALVSFYGYGDISGKWYGQPDAFYNQQPAVSRDEAYRAVGGSVITGTPFEGCLFEERHRFYVYCRQRGLWPREVTGHDPAREHEWFDPFCPIRNVTQDYPPTLLIHGDQDTDVPFEQSVLMSKELEHRGVAHELIKMPNQGHVFDIDGEGMEDPAVSEMFDQVLVFLEKQGMQEENSRGVA